MDTFMESRSDRHPTDLAGLRGARFVSATETEQGRRWNESKIKAITGGDDITARLMHQDFFTYAFVRLSVTVGVAASLTAAQVLGVNPRFAPGDANNQTAVVQVV
jgi:hypothetical protein